MIDSFKGKYDKLIAMVLGAVAFMVYICTLSRGAFPGDSARYIAYGAGLYPNCSPVNPLWNWIAYLAGKMPFGGLTLCLNLFSALCGSFSIVLLYIIVSETIFLSIDVNMRILPRFKVAARLAGIASALFLAFSIPFWVISNRAYPLSFHVLLLLGLTRLFCHYVRTHDIRLLHIFVFLYGLGVVEFGALILFVPFFGLYAIYILWRDEVLQVGAMTKLCLIFICGLLFYFVAAGVFSLSAGYELRKFKSFLQVLWYMWKDQYITLRYILYGTPWLLVLLCTFIPWCVAMIVAPRGLNQEKDWTYYGLHLVMTMLTVMVLINGRLAPWTNLGFSRLVIIPYVLSSTVLGYLVAYWFLFPFMWGEDSGGKSRMSTTGWVGAIIVLPIMITICVMPFSNFKTANASSSEFVNKCADEILDSLNGRTWLVTDGSMDDILRIHARVHRLDLKILNAFTRGDKLYMDYVEGLFKSTRLKNAARIDMFSLINAWIESDDAVVNDLAIMQLPDLWIGAGYDYIPHKMVYFGVPTGTNMDTDRSLTLHREFWSRILPEIEKSSVSSGVLGMLNRNLIAAASKVANNFGVKMQDEGKDASAYEAYQAAIKIYPGNISALLNESVMVQNGFSGRSIKDIRSDIERIIGNKSSKIRVWALSQNFGYVRSPEFFTRLGWSWVQSGRPNMAVTGLKRAMALLPDSKQSSLKQALADVYLMQKKDKESESLYYELLVEKPNDIGALLGLGRIESRRGNFDKALEYLHRAEKAGASSSIIAMDLASLNLLSGNNAKARIILEELVALHPTIVRAQALLAETLLRQKDNDALAKKLEELEHLKGGVGMAALIKGRLAAQEFDWVKARQYFEIVIASQPRNVGVMERILGIDVAQNNKELATEHAHTLLKIDPNNYLANYIIGTVCNADGDKSLAEDSFRRSIEVKQTPEAMNDLAWLLQKRGAYKEAEEIAKTALDKFKDQYTLWDTFGVIMMKTDRLDDAKEAFEKSISIFRGSPSSFLHLAEISAVKNEWKRVEELLNLLNEHANSMPSDIKEEVDTLQRKLDAHK